MRCGRGTEALAAARDPALGAPGLHHVSTHLAGWLTQWQAGQGSLPEDTAREVRHPDNRLVSQPIDKEPVGTCWGSRSGRRVSPRCVACSAQQKTCATNTLICVCVVDLCGVVALRLPASVVTWHDDLCMQIVSWPTHRQQHSGRLKNDAYELLLFGAISSDRPYWQGCLGVDKRLLLSLVAPAEAAAVLS